MTAIDCPYYGAAEGLRGGGLCGLRTKTVSPGVCLACRPQLGVIPIAQPLAAGASAQALTSLRDAAGLANRRLAVCKACDEFNGNLCEKQFPAGCCRCKWAAFIKDAASRCPAGRWGGPKGSQL